MRQRAASFALRFGIAVLAMTGTVQAQTLSWSRLSGIPTNDAGFGVALRSGGVYVSGHVEIGTSQAYGGYLLKYDGSGALSWGKQFYPAQNYYAGRTAANPDGVFVAGTVLASGVEEAYVQKYDGAGNLLWTRQSGLSGGMRNAEAVAADGTGIYVGGLQATTGGGFLGYVRRYDNDGTEGWTTVFGSVGSAEEEEVKAVAADGTDVYVVSVVRSAGGPYDVAVRKVSATGTETWAAQFGSTKDELPSGVAVTSEGVYVTGTTWGVLEPADEELSWSAFVRKYDLSGGVMWTRQFGVGGCGSAQDIAADVYGVYMGGFGCGSNPAFVRRYDHAGNVVWTSTFGPQTSEVLGVASDASGVYATGFQITGSYGSQETFVAKIVQPSKTVAEDLTSAVEGMGLPQGEAQSLLTKLQQLEQAIATNQTKAACGQLTAFQNEVKAQAGKSIPVEQASRLLEQAQQLASALGCNAG